MTDEPPKNSSPSLLKKETNEIEDTDKSANNSQNQFDDSQNKLKLSEIISNFQYILQKSNLSDYVSLLEDQELCDLEQNHFNDGLCEILTFPTPNKKFTSITDKQLLDSCFNSLKQNCTKFLLILVSGCLLILLDDINSFRNFVIEIASNEKNDILFGPCFYELQEMCKKSCSKDQIRNFLENKAFNDLIFKENIIELGKSSIIKGHHLETAEFIKFEKLLKTLLHMNPGEMQDTPIYSLQTSYFFQALDLKVKVMQLKESKEMLYDKKVIFKTTSVNSKNIQIVQEYKKNHVQIIFGRKYLHDEEAQVNSKKIKFQSSENSYNETKTMLSKNDNATSNLNLKKGKKSKEKHSKKKHSKNLSPKSVNTVNFVNTIAERHEVIDGVGHQVLNEKEKKVKMVSNSTAEINDNFADRQEFATVEENLAEQSSPYRRMVSEGKNNNLDKVNKVDVQNLPNIIEKQIIAEVNKAVNVKKIVINEQGWKNLMSSETPQYTKMDKENDELLSDGDNDSEHTDEEQTIEPEEFSGKKEFEIIEGRLDSIPQIQKNKLSSEVDDSGSKMNINDQLLMLNTDEIVTKYSGNPEINKKVEVQGFITVENQQNQNLKDVEISEDSDSKDGYEEDEEEVQEIKENEKKEQQNYYKAFSQDSETLPWNKGSQIDKLKTFQSENETNTCKITNALKSCVPNTSTSTGSIANRIKSSSLNNKTSAAVDTQSNLKNTPFDSVGEQSSRNETPYNVSPIQSIPNQQNDLSIPKGQESYQLPTEKAEKVVQLNYELKDINEKVNKDPYTNSVDQIIGDTSSGTGNGGMQSNYPKKDNTNDRISNLLFEGRYGRSTANNRNYKPSYTYGSNQSNVNTNFNTHQYSVFGNPQNNVSTSSNTISTNQYNYNYGNLSHQLSSLGTGGFSSTTNHSGGTTGLSSTNLASGNNYNVYTGLGHNYSNSNTNREILKRDSGGSNPSGVYLPSSYGISSSNLTSNNYGRSYNGTSEPSNPTTTNTYSGLNNTNTSNTYQTSNYLRSGSFTGTSGPGIYNYKGRNI